MRGVFITVMLLTAIPAIAGAQEDDPKLARMKSIPARRRILGAQLSLGSPDIFALSLVLRPLYWLRLQLGTGTNTAAASIHGGVTFAPLDRRVTPSITVEVGRMFEVGSSFVSGIISPRAYTVDTIQYNYVNLHVGIEAGLPNRVMVYARLGASYLDTTVTGHKTVPPETGSITIPAANLNVWTLSGKLGLVVFFL